PIDKKKIDALLEDIAHLDKKLSKKKFRRKRVNLPNSSNALSPLKKPDLLETEKLVYFDICHYFKLTMLSINHTETALEIWIKGILPLLLQRYMVEIEEWERMCDIGDNNSEIQQQQEESWQKFFHEIIQQGRLDSEALDLINQGKKRSDQLTLNKGTNADQ
ncbi:MAG: hypothetical protein ACTSR4_01040, partial [Candidatus Hodarchaeales archaeon]